MKILISPLGFSPGVVTGAYYALRDNRWGEMDAIITVSTTSDLTRLCEREIEAELERARRELGVNVQYQERLAIPGDEVRTSADVYRFRRLILDLLNKYSQHQVYLSLTGGRKSMVAAAAMAAQLHKPARIFHVYVDEEIEREGHIASLLKKPTDKRRAYLKPPADKIGLVEIPLLSLGERGMDLKPFHARIFESAVGDYLATRLVPPYPQIQYKFYPPYLHGEGLGEVDVLATRDVDGQPEFLLCECKMRERGPVQTDWLERLARKRQRAAEQISPAHPERVKACLVTVEGEIESREKARELGITVYQARLPKDWDKRADWDVEALHPLVDATETA